MSIGVIQIDSVEPQRLHPLLCPRENGCGETGRIGSQREKNFFGCVINRCRQHEHPTIENKAVLKVIETRNSEIEADVLGHDFIYICITLGFLSPGIIVKLFVAFDFILQTPVDYLLEA